MTGLARREGAQRRTDSSIAAAEPDHPSGRRFVRAVGAAPSLAVWRGQFSLWYHLVFAAAAGLQPTQARQASPRRPGVRTWPFQGQNTGSNPVGDASLRSRPVCPTTRELRLGKPAHVTQTVAPSLAEKHRSACRRDRRGRPCSTCPVRCLSGAARCRSTDTRSRDRVVRVLDAFVRGRTLVSVALNSAPRRPSDTKPSSVGLSRLLTGHERRAAALRESHRANVLRRRGRA